MSVRHKCLFPGGHYQNITYTATGTALGKVFFRKKESNQTQWDFNSLDRIVHLGYSIVNINIKTIFNFQHKQPAR